jgi:methanogenic corrinoid protein MtbC1
VRVNITAVSRRTGVPPDTLRKWERRYGVLRPTRTAGGQRLYDDVDVRRVEWLLARIGEGYRIGAAAALLEGPATETAATVDEARDAMLAAVADGDEARLASLLDQALAVHPLATALEEVVHPVLETIGRRWAEGHLTVALEHLASQTIRARLERLLADVRGSVRGVAVLACPPGERHELGLLMLGVLLRADGWQVAFLGADTPLADATGLAELLSAQVLALSIAIDDHRAAVRAEELPKRTPVAVGGAAVDAGFAASLGALRPGPHLARAVEELRSLAA